VSSRPTAPGAAQGRSAHALVGAVNALTPIDYGDVCVNVDTAWFTAKVQAARPPSTTWSNRHTRACSSPRVRATSSPGFAFLLATIGAKGDGWKDYWKADGQWRQDHLRLDRRLQVDFTAGGKGSRPIVLSYASSPPFTIPKGATEPTTAALLDTCFRQVEYAGVLAGAKNPEGAQGAGVLPADQAGAGVDPGRDVHVPGVERRGAAGADWAQWAKVAPKPFTVAPEQIDANRDAWLRDWTDLAAR
jgi:thiamine transport system substrate-binding protein